jgi:hypothetical protein
MENYLFRKGPRRSAVIANLVVLGVYAIFVWGWFARVGDLFMLIGQLGLFAFLYGIYKALAALFLTVKNLIQSKKDGTVESGIWIDLGLSLLPLVLVGTAVSWVISGMKTP